MLKVVRSPRYLRGELRVPGDKSITHRAFLFNAMARGEARVRGYSTSEDCAATLRCLRALGVTAMEEGPACMRIEGRDRRFAAPAGVLDAANSGTTMRLMAGLLAAQPFRSVITGDASLRSRPMDRVIEPLRRMGARIRGAQGDSRAPLEIEGGPLRGIRYRLPVASAQVKSAILIAGLFAQGETVVEEPEPTRDHTERMLRAMGADVRVDGTAVAVRNSGLKAVDVAVPGDLSSAAYWLVAAALHPDADVLVRGVCVNPTRTGILDALTEMGVRVSLENERMTGGEPVADLRVRSSELRGITVAGAMVPRLIDELPLVAVAGAVASGVTEIRDAAELRVKESDRIATMAAGLRRLGATVEERPDGMIVRGGGKLAGAHCESHGDHRVAMSLAVAGLVALGSTEIQGAEAVDKSYRGFWEELERLAGYPGLSGRVGMPGAGDRSQGQAPGADDG